MSYYIACLFPQLFITIATVPIVNRHVCSSRYFYSSVGIVMRQQDEDTSAVAGSPRRAAAVGQVYSSPFHYNYRRRSASQRSSHGVMDGYRRQPSPSPSLSEPSPTRSLSPLRRERDLKDISKQITKSRTSGVADKIRRRERRSSPDREMKTRYPS